MLLICLARTRASGGETCALASLPSHMPRGQWLTRRCARTGATWEFWRTDLPRGQPGRLWPLRPWARRLSARRPRPWRATALVRAHASDVAGKPPAMRRRTAASNRATVRRRSEQASLMNGCNEAQIRAAAAGRVPTHNRRRATIWRFRARLCDSRFLGIQRRPRQIVLYLSCNFRRFGMIEQRAELKIAAT
jgi:hypothetical protein